MLSFCCTADELATAYKIQYSSVGCLHQPQVVEASNTYSEDSDILSKRSKCSEILKRLTNCVLLQLSFHSTTNEENYWSTELLWQTANYSVGWSLSSKQNKPDGLVLQQQQAANSYTAT